MVRFFTNNSANFKGLLFVVGLMIIGGTLWYSQQLVDTLKEKSADYLKFRIKIFESNINNPESNIDISFFFNEIIRGADYPIIYTDTDKNPQSWINISEHLDSVRVLAGQDSVLLINFLNQIAAENDPISISYQGTVLGYYYYGLPPEIYKIRNLPFIAIIISIIFVLFAYLGFTYIKRSEQRNIWVGMAKETAHQLGTPLSSISGWLELIQIDKSQISTAVHEMSSDLERLNKVANRFSKIGSVPQLKEEKIKPVLFSVADYYKRRLPNLNKHIKIEVDCADSFCSYINRELFEWVLENHLKNAIDSIEGKQGEIRIKAHEDAEDGFIRIDITDNGKGISLKNKKNVFKPGFSTKKRGWGLGLSLAKRIIEEYHGGKLQLYETKIGQGSTFRISLKKC